MLANPGSLITVESTSATNLAVTEDPEVLEHDPAAVTCMDLPATPHSDEGIAEETMRFVWATVLLTVTGVVLLYSFGTADGAV